MKIFDQLHLQKHYKFQTNHFFYLFIFLIFFRLSQLEPAEKWLHEIYSKHIDTNLDSKDCNCKGEGKNFYKIAQALKKLSDPYKKG